MERSRGRGNGKSLQSLVEQLKKETPVNAKDNIPEKVSLPNNINKDQFEDALVEMKVQTNLKRHASVESQSSVDSESSLDGDGCICNRNRQKIHCDSCGSTFEGRMRKQCPIHTNVIHLMDFVNCYNCGAGYK